MAVKYILSPLVEDGRDCLACGDVDGMESAALESVEFYYGGSPWQRITRQSDDIFGLAKQGIFKWPSLDNIVAARFRIRLKNEPRFRRVTLLPSDNDDLRLSSVILDWMKKRKFLISSDAA